ncbi:hypothetical protein BBJ28_00003409 [Nothophytophthora sp. Chile5]|nr:hypothetical protein BBJ28_00003409 [Nothophytophthora sp. Chile5]
MMASLSLSLSLSLSYAGGGGDDAGAKTLGDRQAVNLLIEDEANVATIGDSTTKPEVTLALTYKFSATIARKGIFQLPLVATDVSQSVVTLLTSIHASPTQPVLSERQKLQRAEKRSLPAVSKDGSVTFADKKQKTTSSQEENGTTNASQGEGSGASVPPANPQVLKRRHVPTGTMYVSPSCLRSPFLRIILVNDVFVCIVVADVYRRRKGPRGAKLAKK